MNQLKGNDFSQARIQIAKVQRNEKGADIAAIKQCGKSVLKFIGSKPEAFSSQDQPIVDAFRRAVYAHTRSISVRDTLVYESLRQFGLTFCNARHAKKKVRDDAASLCSHIADSLLLLEESVACIEGLTTAMPIDAPLVQAQA